MLFTHYHKSGGDHYGWTRSHPERPTRRGTPEFLADPVSTHQRAAMTSAAITGNDARRLRLARANPPMVAHVAR
jgi:hypothetical protein